MRLTENTQIVIKDAIAGTGALSNTSNVVDLSGFHRCRIALFVDCNDAAPAGGVVTLKQGTSTATSALAFSEYWKSEDVLGGEALTRVEATSLSAGVKNKVACYVFEVKSDQLTEGNTSIRADVTAVTTATGKLTLIYELYEPRYAG